MGLGSLFRSSYELLPAWFCLVDCSFGPRSSAPEFFSLKKNCNKHFVAKVVVGLCMKFGVISKLSF